MYVHLLPSLSSPVQRYVGLATDLKNRLAEHDAGKSSHTSNYAPWELIVAIYFKNRHRATAFERYRKHGSGHAFAGRHFW
jgi:predicted GIY-YIG superfamily endonuclease